MLPGHGKYLVSSGLLFPGLVYENECAVGEKRFGGEAGWHRFGILHEFQSAGMRRKEDFDWPRVRLAGIRRNAMGDPAKETIDRRPQRSGTARLSPT
ncbi:MAG: hypothetical protein WBS18_08270 [Candidatus Acidiferrales bacterium]